MLSPVDLTILIVYLGAMVGFGFWFARKSSNTEEFMAAGRSLPGWAVGLSIFGTFVSSISFLANPGSSYGGTWNAFVFGLSLPLAAFIAVKWFVPFYRNSGEVSAYAHLEHRFGVWARLYLVTCYIVMQFVRIGVIMMLAATPIRLMTGWEMYQIIIAIGILVTVYTLLGGIEAVIWTDVVQSIVLTGGALLCICLIIYEMPEGLGQIVQIASDTMVNVNGEEHSKWSLGSFGPELFVLKPTFWIVLIYGLFINLTNFGVDQAYVQRYITSKTDKDATRSVWLGAGLFIPTSAMLFFIGTALFAYYQVYPEKAQQAAINLAKWDTSIRVIEDVEGVGIPGRTVAEEAVEADPNIREVAASEVKKLKDDQMFPAFIAYEMPIGLKGLLIAAIFAAAMSSIDSSLNGCATLVLVDFYKRFKNKDAGERESMKVLYGTTLVFGVLGTLLGLALIGQDRMLDIWWTMAGIISGGMLGVFLLGIISRRAGNPAAVIAVIIGLIVIGYLTLANMAQTIATAASKGETSSFDMFSFILPFFNYGPENPFLHSYLIIVIGTLTIVLSGMLFGMFFKRPQPLEPTK